MLRLSNTGEITMASIFRYLMPFFFIIPFNILAQDLLDIKEQSSSNLSRLKMQMGYVSLIQQKFQPEFRNYFLNLSYRSSGFNESSKPFTINFAFEPGVNFLFADARDSYSLWLFPYAKFGPEMKITNNVFFGGSLGLLLLTDFENFAPFPFWGVNSFYQINLSGNLNAEIEAGFHSAFYFDNLSYLTYVSIGISIL